MRLMYDPSILSPLIFRNAQWRSTGGVLVTIDDSPNPKSTEYVLSELNKAGVKAMFFCIGKNIRQYPELLKAIAEEGHLIQNHGFSHRSLWFTSNKEISDEITVTSTGILDTIGKAPVYFRPPYGKIPMGISSILSANRLMLMMWSFLTYDYRGSIPGLLQAAKRYLRNDSIVVLHDSQKAKPVFHDALHVTLDTMQEKGFFLGDPCHV